VYVGDEPVHACIGTSYVYDTTRQACNQPLDVGNEALHRYDEPWHSCSGSWPAYSGPSHACSETSKACNATRYAYDAALHAFNAFAVPGRSGRPSAPARLLRHKEGKEMANAGTTSITVRVQAKGGKFLADDAGGAEVTIRDAQTGKWLAGGLALGTDSGNLSTEYTAGASLSTIVTPPPPHTNDPYVVQWLSADSTTSGLVADLAISRPTLLEITAYGPLGGLQSAHRVTTTQWIVPGQNLNEPPGFVVEIPGLLVQVMEPATHLAILSSTLPYTIPLQANVTMMCGCQIADGQPPNQPWVPYDFQVTAAIGQVGQPAMQLVTLTFPGTSPSLYFGSWELPAGATGFYQAVITAVQLSTGNTGTGTATFFVKAG